LPSKKILLDSNSYFRLADNLYPLMSRSFGDKPEYRLCLLGGTLHEQNYEPRLRSKFSWVSMDRHVEDRKAGMVRIPEEKKRDIAVSREFMRTTCNELQLGCSTFDIECLVTAYELGMILVTDDLGLAQLALEYDHAVMSSLELMGLMLDCGCISKDEVTDTVQKWRFDADLPSSFVSEYIRIFGEEPETGFT
jgi:hypothetical protein